MTFVLPRISVFNFGLRVSRIPSGTPATTASNIEMPTSHRCSPVNIATSRLWVSRKFTINPSPAGLAG